MIDALPTSFAALSILLLSTAGVAVLHTLVMYPAAQGSWGQMWIVASVFTLLTLGAMLATVLLAMKGLRLLPIRRIESYTHAIAGAVVLSARCAIQFLGL